MKTEFGMQRWIWIGAIAAGLATGGCASKRPSDAPAIPDASGGTTGDGADAGVSSSGLDGADAAGMGNGEAAGPQGELLSKRIIYFDFDRAELRSEDAAVVAAHSRYLSVNGGTRVRLEGHTDERGTREYNIGLGERRAQTVRRALLLQGAAESQVSTVSYGEERPAAAGSDEMAWRQNRRVEIVYLN
jgi:peptidoglycan-associated lipoprotein